MKKVNCMKLNKLSEELYVGPQIMPGDVAQLSSQGFRSIICNRPDGESHGQPRFDEIEVAARKHGMECRHIPIRPGRVSSADAEAFGSALREMPGPIAAYCRSGNRSAMLWSASKSKPKPARGVFGFFNRRAAS